MARSNYRRSLAQATAVDELVQVLRRSSLTASAYACTMHVQHHTRAHSTASASRYAAVDHSEAYEESIRSSHGRQLELAKLEGVGKDDPPFNPFLEDELEEERAMLAAEEEKERDEIGEDLAEDEDGMDEEGDEEEEEGHNDVSPFNNDGSIRWKKSQLATFRAGAPAGGMFAVVELAGSQHKVTTDDLLVVNLLKPVDHFKVGSVHTLRNVMLVGSSHMTLVGMPYVSGAEIDVMVEEITQDAKVIVFKKRRRKTYKRKNGFRRDVTMLRVLDVRPPKEHRDHQHVQRESPAL